MTPPNNPGEQRVGPNVIEDDRADAAQQLLGVIRDKGTQLARGGGNMTPKY